MEKKFKFYDKEEGRIVTREDTLYLANANPLIIEKDGTLKIEFSRYIPLQYTGLTDKNGIEVCEGDFIRIKYNENSEEEIRVVEKEITRDGDGHLCSGFLLINVFEEENMEVIGNIYENPELNNS